MQMNVWPHLLQWFSRRRLECLRTDDGHQVMVFVTHISLLLLSNLTRQFWQFLIGNCLLSILNKNSQYIEINKIFFYWYKTMFIRYSLHDFETILINKNQNWFKLRGNVCVDIYTVVVQHYLLGFWVMFVLTYIL
jgi:hypothetical protein